MVGRFSKIVVCLLILLNVQQTLCKLIAHGTAETSATSTEEASPKPVAPIVAQLMRNNMRSVAWEEEEWPHESFDLFLTRAIEYQRNLQPFRKRKSALEIMSRHCDAFVQLDVHILEDIVTWNDLQLFHGDEVDGPYLASIIDRCSTEIGRVTLALWMAHLTSDIVALEKRQAVVKKLLDNPALLGDLEEQLAQLQQSENLLLSFWINDTFKRVADRTYFAFSWPESVGNALNNSELALGCKSVVDHNQRVVFLFMSIAATAILPMYGVKVLLTDEDYGFFDKLSEKLTGVGGSTTALISMADNAGVKAAASMAAGAYCSMTIQDAYQWMYGNFILSKCLQEKLIHVANTIRAMQAIDEILQSSGLAADLRMANSFATLSAAAQHANEKYARLLELLQSSTFEGEASPLAHYGKILLAYKLMDEVCHELEDALCAAGEVDAYVSIARLYKEFEHKRVRYTFAQYDAAQDGPRIVLEDFWNPFINPDNAVPNSLLFGGACHPRNLIITGPNAGGKSTAIKAVAMNIILAQSIGIVAARCMSITPFSYIATYLNITDDLAAGKSLFKAQVLRAKQLTSNVEAVAKNQYSFLAIDEMFNGTDVRVGQALSFSVIKDLGKQPNNITILATHFPLLTQLESQGAFSNYRVKATINDAGHVVYTFVLEPGVSVHSVALDMVRNEGFNQSILDEAEQLLS